MFQRRILSMLVAGAALLGATGCVAVSAKNNRFATDSDAVVVNGRVFVVQKNTGSVYEVDLSRAKPYPAASEPKNNDDAQD